MCLAPHDDVISVGTSTHWTLLCNFPDMSIFYVCSYLKILVAIFKVTMVQIKRTVNLALHHFACLIFFLTNMLQNNVFMANV